MTQLHYRTVNARDFISDMHDKYSHYMEERIINTMLNKLEYTLKIATSKLEELEDLDDKIQSNLMSLFKQHFKELTPNPKIVDDIESDHTIFNSKSYKYLISVGRVAANEENDTTQERNAMSSKPSINSDKGEKTKDSHNNSPCKQQNVNKKKDVKKGDDNKGSSNKNISTTSRTS